MDPTNMRIIDHFEIPDEIARELSDLLTQQTIRERLLNQNINNVNKFEEIERLLMPITEKIEVLKRKITDEYVPAKYAFPEYVWNYDGYQISGNIIQIYIQD